MTVSRIHPDWKELLEKDQEPTSDDQIYSDGGAQQTESNYNPNGTYW
jgi:hypothetical protein